MNSAKISASVYSGKEADLIELVQDPELALVDLWHIDCYDNKAVFEDIAQIKEVSDKPIEMHIITEKPSLYFDLIAKHDIDYVSFQYENITEDFRFTWDLQPELGIAILADTQLNDITVFVGNASYILFMSTVPGVSNLKFNPKIIERIKEAKQLFSDKNFHFDGGITQETLQLLKEYSPDVVVSGSYIFNNPNKKAAIIQLKEHSRLSNLNSFTS